MSVGGKDEEHEALLSLVPIYIVTHASQLPNEFLYPSPEKQLVVGFDCEGVDLCRYGTLCIMQGGEKLMQACRRALESNFITKVIHDCKRDSEALYSQYGIKLHNVVDTQHLHHECLMRAIPRPDVYTSMFIQIAYYLIEEQQGRTRAPDDYISFVSLLGDPSYCGSQNFGHGDPCSDLMVRAAADDVRFLPYIFHKMMERLNERSLWQLAVRDALYCRCFCITDNEYADWPSIPTIPDYLTVEDNALEQEILSVLNIPPGKMGRVIGRKGASILSIKNSCNADIVIGGEKGPPDKVFIIGPVKQVRKAEAILRGRM
uniref:K Homology domain-containing protein n=1 Tax=Fagus sylvatica TaxID=28930 RepID=A0A2N9EIL2_FAGSY